MCGRYTLTVKPEALMEYYQISNISSYYKPRYNIAPGQMISAVIMDHQENKRFGQLKWGLIPSWSKDPSGSTKMINAKAETLRDKPAFAGLIGRKRCVIPADGFFEWKKQGNEKQPMRFVLKDRSMFSLAGLYDTWVDPEGNKVHTCTIITTEPNELVAEVHQRMPVILRDAEEMIWLNPKVNDLDLICSILKPYSAENMHVYPVSKQVGRVQFDEEDCILPISFIPNVPSQHH